MSLATGKRWAKAKLTSEFQAWWQERAIEEREKRLGPPSLKPPPDLPRATLARGWLLDQGMETSQIIMSVSTMKTPSSFAAAEPERHHCISISVAKKDKLRFYARRLMTLEDLITTSRGAMCFASLLKETNFFKLS